MDSSCKRRCFSPAGGRIFAPESNHSVVMAERMINLLLINLKILGYLLLGALAWIFLY